ncbi:hypothetical protein O9992_00735 [Vibrio lentus]|nr:hypothetical protein [Vibrio lentus]
MNDDDFVDAVLRSNAKHPLYVDRYGVLAVMQLLPFCTPCCDFTSGSQSFLI